MRIMVFGDIHFHNAHHFSTITSEGYTVRELEHLECAKVLTDLYESKKIDKVVCLGDLWSPVGDTISAQTTSALVEFFARLRDKIPSIDVLIGNHDLILNHQSEIHKLACIKYIPGIHLYETGTEIDDFVYMPYYTDDEKATKFLQGIENKQNKIIFSHLELGNIDLGNGIVTQHGVSLDLLRNFKMTLQGHYHSGGNYGHKIQIAGSTQRLSFKDRGIARKNIIIYDTELDKIERESFNSPDWLTFDDENIENILNVDNNNYVKVELTTDILLTDKIKAKLEQFKGKYVHIDLTRISVNKKVNSDVNNSEDNVEIIRQFVNKSENSEEQKEQLIKEGIRLLDKTK